MTSYRTPWKSPRGPSQLNLRFNIKGSLEVFYSEEELGVTEAPLPKPTLRVCQDVICVQVPHNAALHYVLHDFTNDGSQGSVVCCYRVVTLLVGRDYVSLTPFVWDRLLVLGSLEYRFEGQKDWYQLVCSFLWLHLVSNESLR